MKSEAPTCCGSPMERESEEGDPTTWVCKLCGGDTELREGDPTRPEAPWPYMHGTLIKRRMSGEPRIVEGTLVQFRRGEVVAYGKATFHQRNRITCIVRLVDGREVSVKASRQRSDIDSVWLYAMSKKVPLHHHQYVPSLDEPFIEQWIEP